MRVFILALAILLLPLRGWLGDGMSTAMAIEAAQAPAAVHAMPADAHGMHDMAGMSHNVAAMSHDVHEGHDSHEVQTQTTHDCQSTCSDCQLCHSVAMAIWPELTASVDAPRTAPAFTTAAFASAEPAQGFKPPIS